MLIRKLIDTKTNPRGCVSFEELLSAGGFDELKTSPEMIDYAIFINSTESQNENPALSEQNQARENDTRLMKMLIESKVALSDGEYEVIKDDRYEDKLQYITLKVRNNTSIKKYIVVLDTFKLPYIQMELSAFKLGRLLYIEPEEGLKVSLFTRDRLFYEQLCDEKPQMAYKYDFSIIYYNTTKIMASEDLYLSCSNESNAFDLFGDNTI